MGARGLFDEKDLIFVAGENEALGGVFLIDEFLTKGEVSIAKGELESRIFGDEMRQYRPSLMTARGCEADLYLSMLKTS